MTNSAGSLGDFFSSFPFPAEEKARLADLASNGSTPGHIVKKYVTTTKGYRDGFLKAERIAGFRPGSRLYKEQAVRRIVTHLSEPSHRKYNLYWDLYKDAAVAFIKNELPALDRLLTEVSSPNGTRAVSDMLKAICASAADYGVMPADIATFYQIWGVPRIENFEAMLPEWLKPDESSAQKRQLTRVLSETAALRAIVEKLEATIGKNTDERAEERSRVTSSLDQHRSTEKMVQGLSLQVSKLLETSASVDAIRNLDERLSTLTDKVNRLADKAKAPREEISIRDLQKLANDMKLGIASSSTELANTLTTRAREELAVTTGALEAKISALATELSERREGTASAGGASPRMGGYRSPLIGIHSNSHATYKLTAELDFINAWLHHLLRSHDLALTFEQAVAYHRAFLGSRVVVCDRILALSWIHCLAWQPFTLHMAASPTWSSEEDWAPGAEHLFRPDTGRTPHFVVLHNYDIGLPECYLAPSLALWVLQRESSWQSKLFLVPARPDHTPSAHILEHAVCFSNNEYITTRSLQLGDGVRAPPQLHRDLSLGAEPKIVAQWATPTSHVDYSLTSIQRALKCRMTLDVVSSFERVASFVGRYLDASSAISFTMHHQVIPWVQATYGEAKATELSNLLQTMAGSVE